MSIHKQIEDDIKEAMKAKDADKLTVLRGLKASFNNELMDDPTKTELSDDEALTIIQKAVKQRKDSIEQFQKGDREDLAEKEQKELEILNKYMPEQMSEDEIKEVAEKMMIELGVADKSQTGVLMGALMKELKGKADGTVVKGVVEKLLN